METYLIICLENSDWTCIINPETKMDTGELYMTFKLLKRRYRSTETDDHLRRLDYIYSLIKTSLIAGISRLGLNY